MNNEFIEQSFQNSNVCGLRPYDYMIKIYKRVCGEVYSYTLTKISMARKSPRPYWLFVTEVANILGITKDRAHEAASHVWPDCVGKRSLKSTPLRYRSGDGEEEKKQTFPRG